MHADSRRNFQKMNIESNTLKIIVHAANFYILYPSILYCSIFGGKVAHTIKDKKGLLARIRRIKGQAEALERALDQEADCASVLQQIAAIRGAINGLMMEVLEDHLIEHLGPQANDAHSRSKELGLTISVLRSYLK